MKKITIPLVLSAMMILGCDDYKGTLTAERQLTLKDKKGKDLIVPVGAFEAKVGGGSKVTLTVTVAGKKLEARFSLPNGQKIKSFNDVNVPASVSGQPYDVRGEESTGSQDTGVQNAVESCTITTVERRCGYETTPQVCRDIPQQGGGMGAPGADRPDRPELGGVIGATIGEVVGDASIQHGPRPEGPRPGGPGQGGPGGGWGGGPGHGPGGGVGQVCVGGETRYVCRDENVTRYGQRDAQFYYTNWQTNRYLQLFEQGSGQRVAIFRNISTSTDKHYTFQGVCRL